MKKFLCKFLAFIMLAGVCSFELAKEVKAEVILGDRDFQYHQSATLNTNLVLNRENRISSGTYNEVLLSFPALDGLLSGKSMDKGTYTLTYVYDETTLAEVLFYMEKTQCQITYRLRDTATNALIPISSVVGTDVRGIKYYVSGVETQLSTNAIGKFDGTTATELKYLLPIDDGIAIKTVTPSSGVEEEIFKISWQRDGRIYYSTNKAVQGAKIYNFNLKGKTITNEDALGTDGKTFEINTGYNLRNDVTVTSKAMEKGSGFLDYVNIADEYEAAHEPSIVFNFRLPQKWDSANKEFVDITALDSIYPDFSIGTIKIDTISNILTTQPSPLGAKNEYQYTYNPTTKMCTLELKNMPQGMIYNNSFFSIETRGGGTTQYHGVKADDTVFGPNDVYTLLPYVFLQNDLENYVIQITKPYKYITGGDNTYGKYTLYQLSQLGSNPVEIGALNVAQGLNDRNETLSIPLPVNAVQNDKYYYRIDFTIPESTHVNKIIPSQISHYQPSATLDSLEIPRDFTILDSKTISVKDPSFSGSGGVQDFAKIKFSFTVGMNDVLFNMATGSKGVSEIDYHILSDIIPKSKSAEDSLILKVELDQSQTAANKDIISNIEILTADNGVPNNPNGAEMIDWNYSLTQRKINNITTDYGTITAEILVPIAPRTDVSKTTLKPIFAYSSVYYAAIRGVYAYTQNGSKSATTETSNEVSINIDAPASYSVPSPMGLTPSNVDINSFKLSWTIPAAEAFSYMDNALNPQKLTLSDNSISYDLYLGGKFDKMKALAERTGNPPTAATDPDIFEVSYDPSWNYEIDFGSLAHPPAYSSANEFLRSGGVYLIKNIIQKDFTPQNKNRSAGAIGPSGGVTLKGLDDNTPFYVIADTVFVPASTEWEAGRIGVPGYTTPDKNNPDGQPVVIPPDLQAESRYSKLTPVVTVTTKVGTDEPDPEEFEPPAPTGLKSDKTQEMSTEITWNRLPDAAIPANLTRDMFEYEIVRVKGNALPDSFITNKNTMSKIKDFLNKEYPQMEIAGWETDYNRTELSELMANPHVINKMPYAISATQHIAKDIDMAPGSMYVYYVRTVLKDANGGNLKYSVWVPVSATSSPVKGPINLVSVREGNYDKLTEAYISFDAPCEISQVRNGDYTLVYQIKPDGEEWGSEIKMATGSLIDGETPVPDELNYYNYKYLIPNLEAGSSYMIRVRLIDNSQGDKSMWSNIITHRTEVDPNKPDDKTTKWNDYFQKKLEEILRRPYWVITDKNNTFEAVYRTSMFDGEIGNSADNIIMLGKDGYKNQSYYIPAKSIAKAEMSQKGFKLVSDNVTIIIPPKFINADSTQSLKDIMKEVNSGKIKDYFIKISLNLATSTTEVNGVTPSSDRIELSVKTVGFKEFENVWDALTAAEAKVMFSDAKIVEAAEARIERHVANGADNTEMVKFVEQEVREVELDFIDSVRRDFDDKKLYEYEVTVFAQPVRIVAYPAESFVPGAAASITGYQMVQGNWNPVPSTPYGSGKSIVTPNPGVYVFAGATIVIPGIGEMENGGKITELVLKYGFDDYFGKGQSFSTAIPLSNDALIGTVARMAGASTTQDATAYLRDKGITVTNRNQFSPAQNEVTIYLVMSLYEIKTSTKVSAVRITNHNSIKNISGIGAKYVPYYKAAYEVGILDKEYQPKAQMTVKEYLTILGKLAGKVNL